MLQANDDGPLRLLGWEAGKDGQGPVEKGAGRLRWLQFWLQLVGFMVIRGRARPYLSAGHRAYGTATNRRERDHDGLAVWGAGVRVPSAPPHPLRASSHWEGALRRLWPCVSRGSGLAIAVGRTGPHPDARPRAVRPDLHGHRGGHLLGQPRHDQVPVGRPPVRFERLGDYSGGSRDPDVPAGEFGEDVEGSAAVLGGSR